jgi:hypothetical protein
MAVKFHKEEERKRYDKAKTYIFKVGKRQHNNRLNDIYIIAKLDIVTCISIARQRVTKNIHMAKNMQATMEGLPFLCNGKITPL